MRYADAAPAATTVTVAMHFAVDDHEFAPC
jgi:hypothetical protein